MIKTTCPICQQTMEGETADWPDLPFCSPRCKTIDLGRWLSEERSLPAVEIDDSDGLEEQDLP